MAAPTPHVLKGMDPNKKDFDHEEAIASCREWIRGVFSKSNCVQLNSSRRTKCDCMMFLQNPPMITPDMLDPVARYMVHWASLPLATKSEVLHEWMKVADFVARAYPDADNPNRLFRLPALGEDPNAGLHSIFVDYNVISHTKESLPTQLDHHFRTCLC